MAMDVDVPDTTHMEAAEIGISHNNGVNCNLLAAPGKHSLEARVVRQRYNVQAGAIEHEQVKFRATVLRKSTEKGTIETGNPYGSTEKFSVLRYEEIVDGEALRRAEDQKRGKKGGRNPLQSGGPGPGAERAVGRRSRQSF